MQTRLFWGFGALMVLCVGCSKPNAVQYAGSVRYTVNNDSTERICAVQMAPTGNDTPWGDNWMVQGEVLEAGAARTFLIAGHPLWALSVTFCDGHIHRGNNIPADAATETAVSSLSRVTTTLTVANDFNQDVCSVVMAPPNTAWGNSWLQSTLRKGGEASFIVLLQQEWFVQAVLCSSGRFREIQISTYDSQRVAVSQMPDVSSEITLVNALTGDLCEIDMVSASDKGWGNNWLAAGEQLPMAQSWSAMIREVDALALRAVTCDGRAFEGRGWSGLEDIRIQLSDLQPVEPPSDPSPWP